MTASRAPAATGRPLRGPEAARLAGISYRQLDYWDRCGIVEPSVDARGSGSQRLYSQADLRRLRAVKGLLDAGMTLASARRALQAGPSAVRGVADLIASIAVDLELDLE